MSEPMFRPRSAIEIVDLGFSIYRAHFGPLAAIWLALLGPFDVAGALIGGEIGTAISNLSGFMIPVAVGATVAVVSDAMHGRPVSIAGAFRQISGRTGTLLLVAFTQSILTFLGAILLIIPGVVVYCWVFAAPMTVVVERVNETTGAITRSKQLARGQFWHILGTLLTSWLIFGVVLIAAGMGFALIGGFVTISETINNLVTAWAVILALPITGAVSGALYFDLRVRTDAYDVERLAQVLDENAAESTAT
jgi:Uncharacterised protein family (UPF0259)